MKTPVRQHACLSKAVLFAIVSTLKFKRDLDDFVLSEQESETRLMNVVVIVAAAAGMALPSSSDRVSVPGKTTDNVGLRLLCLDGGGIRGLSELLMLEAIMRRVRNRLQLEEMPIPADYFDMIGGTSTGGLIAIMLGRLRMTIEETIEGYEKLSKTIFQTKRSRIHDGKYSRKPFEAVIKSVVASKLDNDENAKMREPSEPSCKSFVCTVSARSVPQTRLFRSYQVPDNEYDCTIWEAAAATCAAPTYFERVEIGPEGRREEFFDGGVGSNNPIKELHREAETVFDMTKRVSCILSLGTGARNNAEVERPGLFDRVVIPKSLVKSFQKMALSSKQYATDMERKYENIEGLYFRLNVDHGLQDIKLADWEKLGMVKTHTHTYLQSPDISRKLDQIAEALIGRPVQDDTAYTLAHLSMSNKIVIDAVQKASKNKPLERRTTFESLVTLERRPTFGSSTTLMNENPRDLLRTWLSSGNANEASALSDHDIQLAKRFRNEATNYTTGDWITEQSQWQKFVKEDSRAVLWVQGPPGCGKSVLTASMINKLQSLQADQKSVVIYHYCHRDPLPTSSMDVVRSLLVQQLKIASEEVIENMFTVSKIRPLLSSTDSDTEGILWKMLRLVIEQSSVKVYVVIDGVDELRTNASPLRRILAMLEDLLPDQQMCLLLSSRFDCDIIEAVQRMAGVELLELSINTDLVSSDIFNFVSFQVNNKDAPLRRKPQSTRDDIVTKICKQAQTSFLYAKLVLDELKGERISSPADISATLRNLPSKLYDIYNHHLTIPQNSERGKEAFQWICCAVRPLTWNELRSALAIVDDQISEDHLIDDSCEVFVQHSCGQLVEAFGDLRDKLRFIHPTVKDMLLIPDGPGSALQISDADGTVALKLLKFLQNDDLPDFSPDSSFEDNRALIFECIDQPGFALYPYAVLNWYSHLGKVQPNTPLLSELEDQLCNFLASTASVTWLKTALFMSRWTDASKDSTALATDVVEGLQAWIRVQSSAATSEASDWIRSWLDDFLDLMTDWDYALEQSPYWIHFIPERLMNASSCFRESLRLGSDQDIVQLEEKPVLTARSSPNTWQRDCFSVDEARSLAYTWDQALGAVSCYHTGTGLLAAQKRLQFENADSLSFKMVRGTLCPQSRNLALLFQAQHAIDEADPMYEHMRRGLQPSSVMSDGKMRWVRQNELCITEYIAMPLMMGINSTRFVVCLLELTHDGLMRTNLFGHPAWSFKPVCITLDQWIRWELDDLDILAFSEDSSLLSTPAGVLSMNTGKLQDSWSLSFDTALTGGKLSGDTKTLALVHSWNTLELVDTRTRSACNSHHFDGIVHILALSEKARFALLLRTQQHKAGNSGNGAPIVSKPNKFLQNGFLGIFDWKTKQWIPLLETSPPLSRKLATWDFSGQHMSAQFSPESVRVTEPNFVVFQVPAGWRLCTNIRREKSLSGIQATETPCLVVFKSEKLKNGFGLFPIVTSMVPLFALRKSLIPSSFYGRYALTYAKQPAQFKGVLPNTDITIYQTDQASMNLQKHLIEEREISNEKTDSGFRVLLRSVDDTGLTQIDVVPHELDNSGSTDVRQIEGSKLGPFQEAYEITIRELTYAGRESQVQKLDIRISGSDNIAPVRYQNFALSNSGLHIGTTVIRTPDAEVQGVDTRSCIQDQIFQRAVEAFRRVCHPFLVRTQNLDQPQSENRRTIFSGREIKLHDFQRLSAQSLMPFEDVTNRFLASNITTIDDDQVFVQFTRALEPVVSEPAPNSAIQYEVFLCIFSQAVESIKWYVHTTTGGELQRSLERFPETIWSLHPSLPIMIWTLPGHVLRISHIDSNSPPINVADPLFFDTEASDAIKFSPNGRFVAIKARYAFSNNFIVDVARANKTRRVLLVLDLEAGTSTVLQASVKSMLSYDLDNESIQIYQLTNRGAIQMDRLFLPDLNTCDRSILAFVPNHCCCATCSKPLENGCHVYVRESQGAKQIVLGHSPVHVGRAPTNGIGCEPLVLHISSPAIEVDLLDTNDSLMKIRRRARFPALVDAEGHLLSDAFRRKDSTSFAYMLKLQQSRIDTPTEGLEVTQMQSNMVNFTDNDGRKLTLQDIEPHFQEQYDKNHKDLTFKEEFLEQCRKSLTEMISSIFGETSWSDIRDMLSQSAESDPDMLDRLMLRGFSIGCALPLSTHTFYFPSAEEEETSFEWSSAADIGWIDESTEWFYRRFWDDDFLEARMWFFFEPYSEIDIRKLESHEKPEKMATKLKKMAKAREDRSHWQSLADLAKTPFPGETDGDKDTSTNEEAEKAVGQLFGFQDYLADLEETIPGLGKLMRSQINHFMNESLMREDE